MRLIDADALISEIKKETEKAIEQDDRVGSFWLGYAAGLVIKQPTIQPEVLACGNGELVAQPEPQWIPVSERLPEEAGYYMTSNEYNGVGEDFYYDGHFWNADKNAYEVLAWMPKPEAYKPNK